MSEYTESSKQLIKLIKEKKFLFRKGMDEFSIPDYLKWFEKKNGIDFFAFPALLPYRADLIDLYSKKVVNTMFLPAPGGTLAMHTVVQISPKCHLIFIYSNSQDNHRVILFCTVYVSDPEDFFNFLDEADPYIVEDEKHVGFLNTNFDRDEKTI